MGRMRTPVIIHQHTRLVSKQGYLFKSIQPVSSVFFSSDSETANSFVQQMYETAAAGTTSMLTRYGLTPQKSDLPYSAQVQQMQKTKMNAKKDDFKTFHDIPSSSLMLSTYDPFYSPLLSRLDAVFQQMNLGKDEKCREKLICMMYANPAKYAPYSNLVSAQLSR
jgi:hypothetical protein